MLQFPSVVPQRNFGEPTEILLVTLVFFFFEKQTRSLCCHHQHTLTFLQFLTFALQRDKRLRGQQGEGRGRARAIRSLSLKESQSPEAPFLTLLKYLGCKCLGAAVQLWLSWLDRDS